MSKKAKENKHQVPDTLERQVVFSKYFTNVKWLDKFDTFHLVSAMDPDYIKACPVLERLVSQIAERLVGTKYEQGYNVLKAKKYYYHYSCYEFTNKFAVFWLDYYIDRVSESIYNVKYDESWANSEFKNDSTKRDKQADKLALQYKNEFLSELDSYNKNLVERI